MTSLERYARADLGELTLLAKGGQARIYSAPRLQVANEIGPFVFKEYKKKNISISGLDGMTAFRHRLADYDRAVLDVLTNWPLRVVEEPDGGAAGVILSLISDDFFHELDLPDGTRKRRPRDGEYLPQPPPRCAKVGIPFLGLGDRYRICCDLAFAVGFLHKREVCVGDISFGNFAYAVHLKPCVYLVDCDAVRIRGSAPVVPQLHTPDWPPPGPSRPQSFQTDLYKMGLFILRVLTPRTFSAQNRDPAWADSAIDPRGRYLLRKALAHDPSGGRPTAKDWFSYFSEMLRRRRLQTTPSRSRMPQRRVGAGA